LLNNIARNELWRKAEGQARKDNAETEATRHHKKQRDKQERTMQRQRPQDTTKNKKQLIKRKRIKKKNNSDIYNLQWNGSSLNSNCL
jgi:hypothetical protein